ncbi:beta-N-acetylhexosaminidase [Dysgonomonas sp. HDW5A]|uniref:beta-N-acetylhexosaminidase n=1 Tax=Dysgonomonas sp. HDW5A TaxID=2714926 RepID=UPI00140C6294|nr:beta-N-acetylhexosaminidase [Dysgonomonas sp. HDW5A]QIK61436.1 beta-N-acetylhexosaminidase [Dysgonomonas sp. HDW5A]
MNIRKTRLSTLVIFIFCFLALSLNTYAGSEINVIPKPQKVSLGQGYFSFNPQTKLVYADNALKSVADAYQNVLKNEFSIQVTLQNNKVLSENVIDLQLDSKLGKEAYVLDVQTDKIVCKASGNAGLFYGLQTLAQLIQTENGKSTVPVVFIEDAPVYGWRGYMLDESRHFMGKDVVKQYLDIMARLKLNVFHWHLTDEQGWRIEIKRYPLLTQEGSVGSWSDANAPSAFYTQDEIKEIVEYAAQRHIMVVPEIDMPGHATAVGRSYPEISGGGEGRWKDFTFHPARETTYEFISNIFDEVVELFPAPYIHIGADEVHFGNQSWFTDPQIQKFIKNHNLKDEIGMEHYFVRRVCDIVNAKGRKMIGWDEIVNTGVSPDKAIIMWWRHDKPELLTQALNDGFDIILTPRIPCYFDFVQDDNHKIGRRWAGDFNELETVYNFSGNISKLISSHPKQVLGMQANVWTERIKDKKRLDFMTYPRLMAIAENAWTDNKAANLNYNEFENRVKIFLKYLDQFNINYFNPFNKNSTPEPWGPDRQDVLADG